MLPSDYICCLRFSQHAWQLPHEFLGTRTRVERVMRIKVDYGSLNPASCGSDWPRVTETCEYVSPMVMQGIDGYKDLTEIRVHLGDIGYVHILFSKLCFGSTHPSCCFAPPGSRRAQESTTGPLPIFRAFLWCRICILYKDSLFCKFLVVALMFCPRLRLELL